MSPQAPEQAVEPFHCFFGKIWSRREESKGVHRGKEGAHVLSRFQPPEPLSRKGQLTPSLPRPCSLCSGEELHGAASAGSFLEAAFAVPPSHHSFPRDVSSPASSSRTSQDFLFPLSPVACSPVSIPAGDGQVLAGGKAMPGVGIELWLGLFSLSCLGLLFNSTL